MTSEPTMLRVAAIVVSVILLVGFAFFAGPRFVAGEHDFVHLYANGRFCGSKALYEPSAHRELQERLFGRHMPAVRSSVRLPFQALLMRPFALFEYKTAWWLFFLLNLLLAIWFYRVFFWKQEIALLIASGCLSSYVALISGQDVWIALAFCAAACLLMESGKEFQGGLVLSLCAIKPHLFLLLPAALAFHRKWRTLAGGVCGAIILTVLSYVAGGRNWPREFLKSVTNPVVHPSPELMPSLRSLVLWTAGPDLWPFWGGSILVAAVVVLISLAAEDWRTSVAAALAGSMLVAYHAYASDTLLLLLGFALLWRNGTRGPAMWLWGVLISPLPMLLLLSGSPLSVFFPVVAMAALCTLGWQALGQRRILTAGVSSR